MIRVFNEILSSTDHLQIQALQPYTTLVKRFQCKSLQLVMGFMNHPYDSEILTINEKL